MVVLDREADLGVKPPHPWVHGQVVGRPVLRVAIGGDDPKDLDHPIATQVQHRAGLADVQFFEPPLLPVLATDDSVTLTRVSHKQP